MMETGTELIKACRTCGIHYVTPSPNQLKHLFQSALEHSEVMLIRLELAQWNVEVAENDGYPQYVCNTCIHKFEQVFQLRASCINAQNEFRKFYNVPNPSFANIKVKTEITDEDEDLPICDFIYVDELSDSEYDGATPFNVPHVPIKEEVIEAATIPMEEMQQSTSIDAAASSLSLNQPDQAEQVVASHSTAIAVEPVECKLCHQFSSNQEEHKLHLQRVHEIRDMECNICGKEFKNSTPSRLKFHMKWHTLNKHVKCNQCAFVCSSKEALKEHKRANHGKLNCKICGKGVLAKKMKIHLRQHEIIPKFSCEYCTEAFATDDERENHIWQIHANEEKTHTSNSLPSTQLVINQDINENVFKIQQEEGDEIMCQEPQNNLLYKFICAHCNQRFMEQIDLETHVNLEHRPNTQIPIIEPQINATEEDNAVINKTAELTLNGEEMEDHTNIAVFEDYDNDDSANDEINQSSSVNQDTANSIAQQAALSDQFVAETEHMENEEIENVPEHSELAEEYHTETTSHTSAEENEEDENVYTDEENESAQNLPVYDSNPNTFACAKCTETFATIEQLRQHYEQHLASQPQSPVTPTKSNFKCNLCGKSFGLKFSLNRHVKKHKSAPI